MTLVSRRPRVILGITNKIRNTEEAADIKTSNETTKEITARIEGNHTNKLRCMNNTNRLAEIETVITWITETMPAAIVDNNKEGRVINTRETRTMGLLSRKSRISRKLLILLVVVTAERIFRGKRRSLRHRLWTRILRHLIK